MAFQRSGKEGVPGNVLKENFNILKVSFGAMRQKLGSTFTGEKRGTTRIKNQSGARVGAIGKHHRERAGRGLWAHGEGKRTVGTGHQLQTQAIGSDLERNIIPPPSSIRVRGRRHTPFWGEKGNWRSIETEGLEKDTLQQEHGAMIRTGGIFARENGTNLGRGERTKEGKQILQASPHRRDSVRA